MSMWRGYAALRWSASGESLDHHDAPPILLNR
jgi:hypothetical protein